MNERAVLLNHPTERFDFDFWKRQHAFLLRRCVLKGCAE
jgi:hypothetical protein